MRDEPEFDGTNGYDIAEIRIAREAEVRTGTLDLGGLALEELPPGVFELRHLRVLNLGPYKLSEQGEFIYWEVARGNKLGYLPAEIGRLDRLTSLFLWQNRRIDDLSPLSCLTALQGLNCSFTKVADLAPIENLPELREAIASQCRIVSLPRGLLDETRNIALELYATHIPGIPNEELSTGYGDNCAPRLRAYFADLDAGLATVPLVKLIVLGNGRVGKTQLCRRLMGQGFDETVKSTHGITIAEAELAARGGGPLKAKLWDFGGQDIYHGTHGLFLKTRAIFIVCWSPDFEAGWTDDGDGNRFQNQPLAYWLDYIASLGGTDMPVLLVQTRCDTKLQEARELPEGCADRLLRFRFTDQLQLSARTPRKLESLRDSIADASGWLDDEYSAIAVGKGRMAVIDQLGAMLREDDVRPPEARQHRTLTIPEFETLCAKAGGISSPKYFLEFLHRAGLVFYREKHFDDRIVLDQAWALDAIYAVFERGRTLPLLKDCRGRFTRAHLEATVWRDRPPEEQEIFLAMMLSCGIIFREQYVAGEDFHYVAPELLPTQAEMDDEISERWDADAGGEELSFAYQMLHDGFIRTLIAGIGTLAGRRGLYWKTGVTFRDRDTGARALISAESGEGRAGRVWLKTQKGDAKGLMRKLVEFLGEAEQRYGIAHMETEEPAAVLRRDPEEAERAPIDPVAESYRQPTYGVSYAWGDDTPEGIEREARVDALCAHAATRDITILRDKNAMKSNDKISEFMVRLGASDRLYVILSDKYLRSSYCVYELYLAWKKAGENADRFHQDVRIFATPDARIADSNAWYVYVEEWQKRFIARRDQIRQAEVSLAPERLQEWDRMLIFINFIDKILYSFSDRLRPRAFEDFLAEGFA